MDDAIELMPLLYEQSAFSNLQSADRTVETDRRLKPFLSQYLPHIYIELTASSSARNSYVGYDLAVLRSPT